MPRAISGFEINYRRTMFGSAVERTHARIHHRGRQPTACQHKSVQDCGAISPLPIRAPQVCMQASTAGGKVFGVFSQGGSCVDGATCAAAAEGCLAGEGHTAGGAVASVFSQCPVTTIGPKPLMGPTSASSFRMPRLRIQPTERLKGCDVRSYLYLLHSQNTTTPWHFLDIEL